MLSSPYFTRLAAATTAGLLLALALANARVLTAAPKAKPTPPSAYASKECAIGEAIFAAGFARANEVLSVTPVGPPQIKGEPAPAPLLRIIGRDGTKLSVIAPAKGEIVAVAKSVHSLDHNRIESWSVTMIPCADHLVTLDGLAALDRKVMRKLGAIAPSDGAFVKETRIKVSAGDVIGEAARFDVALFSSNGLTAKKRQSGVQDYLSPPAFAARCPLEHFNRVDGPVWRALFGDSRGARLPGSQSACATSQIASPTAAQGVWLTDSSHGARTNKIASAALTSDFADPGRLVFSFFGRLASLDASAFDAPDAAQRAEAARTYLTAQRGRERINAPFSEIVPDAAYCYENLRAGLDGPRLKGVVIMMLTANASGAPILKVEAISSANKCETLREPWTFTGSETAFFRQGDAAN